MIIKAFEKQPVIDADQISNVTFANRASAQKIYEFEFKSFADENFVCELGKLEKINNDVLDDKISTYDEEDDINVLISLIRAPTKGQRRNSSAQSQKCELEFEYLNRKRNCSDFHSQADNSELESLGHNVHFSERLSHRNINLLDDSIDEAIMNNNLSAVSFDADVVHDMSARCRSRKAKHEYESKKVKLSLDC